MRNKPSIVVNKRASRNLYFDATCNNAPPKMVLKKWVIFRYRCLDVCQLQKQITFDLTLYVHILTA